MVIKIELSDIHPRDDIVTIIARIEHFLALCDPSDRPTVMMEVPV